MDTAAHHEAVLDLSAAELAPLVAERVDAAAAAGHLVTAAVGDGLRAALGGHHADFLDPLYLAQAPAFTVALRLARLGRRAAELGTEALVLVQHGDLPGCSPAHRPRLEIALNVAITDLPVAVLCLYAPDDPLRALARHTHPLLTTPSGARENREFALPGTAVVEYPPPPPDDLGAPLLAYAFGRDELVGVREVVARVARDLGFSGSGVDDVVLAVSELATNAVEHGDGAGTLRMWADAALTVEIHDGGGGMDVPFPGLVLPPPDGARGRGLWMAAELCDVLQVWPEADATTVRVLVTPR